MNIRLQGGFRIILIFGLVSLFADITYEGARSIVGPYLSILGASPAYIGIVVGFGELVGFGLRVVSGYVSDRIKKYYGITLFGYLLSLFSVPLIGLTRSWEAASSLVILERFGKAIRTPARDVILSRAIKAEKRGLGFGIHEALDQIGAITGPIICATVLYVRGDYREAFIFLIFPAILSIFFLLLARGLSDTKERAEVRQVEKVRFEKDFIFYISGMALIGAGFFDFALIAYHFKDKNLFSEGTIPFLYAFAMAVNGLSAPFLGRIYDRVGIRAIFFVSALTSISPPLLFLLGPIWAYLGMFLWGFGMASQESICRAHIANLVSEGGRGKAYGLFNGVYGLFWFLGSGLLGILYEKSILASVLVSTGLQLVSLPFFYLSGRSKKMIG